MMNRKLWLALIIGITACSKGTGDANITNIALDTAKRYLFMDVHNLEPGKVKFDDVAGAHFKDLATQNKYGVNFVNYWVDEKDGIVMCVAEAPDSITVINMHNEAHGLIPTKYIS